MSDNQKNQAAEKAEAVAAVVAPKHGFPNILMVEDSEADAELIQIQVKSIWPSSNINVVDSLSKAYEAYKTAKLDLFLLDLNLPDGFGPKSVEEVLAFSRKVPVLVITGMESMLMVNEALNYGARGVIFKNKIMSDDFKHLLQKTIKV